MLTTRQINHQLGKHYGPFTNLKTMCYTIDFIKSLHTIRRCKCYLFKENICKQKFKVCMECQLGPLQRAEFYKLKLPIKKT